ncbi:MAG TPA: DNA alkylation repair protein [Candidatus Eisenbacteria bacterium]
MTTKERVADALAWLEKRGTKRTRDGMARYGITAKNAYGVPVGTIKQLGKQLGRDHGLALALWKTGVYEAQLLTAFVGDPARVTVAQMNAWSKDFDNWGVVDTLCFNFLDLSPLAWKVVGPWSRRKDEFQKRGAFALLACLAAHDKASGDAPFLASLAIIEAGATDERNFVKKGVSWALRLVGRRSPAVYAASISLAEKLAASDNPTARWVGKDALRDLMKPAVRKRLAATKGKKS